MRSHKKLVLLLLTVLSIAMVTAMATLRGQTQNNRPSLNSQSSQESAEEQIPIVDFIAPEPADPDTRARRKAKGKRYDKGRPEKVEELPDQITPLPLIAHWWQGLPALPVAQSDVIVLGEIIDAQAHLSDDRSGIYSEFTIHIDELLKSDSQSSLAEGNKAVAERLGGKVKFPSGKVQQYSIYKQGMPRVGGRYVLFLKRNGEGQDFSIITGYELRNGTIVPLDNAHSGSGGSELPFDAYKGANGVSFLASVRDAVAAQGGKNQ